MITNGLSSLKPCGPDLHEARKIAGANRNAGVLQSPVFQAACERAGIEPTKRQASKWNNGYGSALKRRNG